MGSTLVPGSAEGTAMVLDEALSFWGGVDPATGRVIDQRHPQAGAELAGAILVMPSGRGSSSSSSVLAETVRAGTAPAGVILRDPDPIVALGAMVAGELYGAAPPVVVLDGPAYDRIATGDRLRVEAGDGREPKVSRARGAE
ncbi:MAG: aconitase X swivel domain-containing protein [Actinomycetota bacterium]